MFIPGQAGYSALRQAGRLLMKRGGEVAEWGGGGMGAGVIGFFVAPGSLSVVSLVAGGAAGVIGVVLEKSKSLIAVPWRDYG